VSGGGGGARGRVWPDGDTRGKEERGGGGLGRCAGLEAHRMRPRGSGREREEGAWATTPMAVGWLGYLLWVPAQRNSSVFYLFKDF
jgi:hypothetical protein